MTETVDTAAPADAPASRAQSLYDRMLATRTKLKNVGKRFDQVKATIVPVRVDPAPATFGQALKPSTFFEGMDLILADLDRMADELASSIEDLAKVF